MNKELFNRIVEFFNTGDTKDVAQVFGEGYIDYQKPEWFTVDGPEEFAQIVELARNSLPNLKVSIVGKLISEDDMIVGRLKWLSDKGERETIEMLRIDDGRFVEHWGALSYDNEIATTSV
jgi:predicted SnoaL-like aldol condensation-catalyzing enzyme